MHGAEKAAEQAILARAALGRAVGSHPALAGECRARLLEKEAKQRPDFQGCSGFSLAGAGK